MSLLRLSLAWAILLSGLSIIMFSTNPPQKDFLTFYQAVHLLRQGMNPYQVNDFVSPLYVLIYWLPISLLPIQFASKVHQMISFIAFFIVYWRFLQGSMIALILALASLPTVISINFGNLDWMPLLGGLVNPFVGIWLALVKPQAGLILALLLLRRSFLVSKKWAVLNALLPSSALAFSALQHYGFAAQQQAIWNVSLFPWSIPLALVLIVLAWQRDSAPHALAASPFLSPYVVWYSYTALIPLLRDRRRLAIFLVASWFLYYYTAPHFG